MMKMNKSNGEGVDLHAILCRQRKSPRKPADPVRETTQDHVAVFLNLIWYRMMTTISTKGEKSPTDGAQEPDTNFSHHADLVVEGP
jgi:hypothetical protein